MILGPGSYNLVTICISSMKDARDFRGLPSLKPSALSTDIYLVFDTTSARGVYACFGKGNEEEGDHQEEKSTPSVKHR